MKKSLVLMAMAGVALAGCVADKEFEPSFQQEQAKITFGAPVMYDNNVGSRAVYHGEINSFVYGSAIRSYPRDERFKIFAVKYSNTLTAFPGWTNAQPALFNEKIAHRDQSLDGWIPQKGEGEGDDPYYYWPSDMKLAYAACSPADLEQGADWDDKTQRTYGATGLKITNFKVPASAENHFDLLFSKRHVGMTKELMYGTADKYSGSPIEFQHALSSIHFSLLNESESTDVILQKISLFGVYDTGTFNENIYNEFVPYDRSNAQVVSPAWTEQDNIVNENLAYVAFDATQKDDEGKDIYKGLQFPSNAQYISSLMAEEGNEDAGVNHVLLLLPQTLPANAELRIDYKVVNGANTVNAHKKVLLNNALKLDATTNKPSATDKINEWVLGTKYTYRLVYSSAAAKADKIYFAPSTEGWIDAGVAVIDLAGAASVTPPSSDPDEEENKTPGETDTP